MNAQMAKDVTDSSTQEIFNVSFNVYYLNILLRLTLCISSQENNKPTKSPPTSASSTNNENKTLNIHFLKPKEAVSVLANVSVSCQKQTEREG